MTSNAFDASIRASLHFLNECGLLRGTTALRSLPASKEFLQLTLNDKATYKEVYLCGLRNSDYSFLLMDFSYFQFSFFSNKHYRFAYYPNPFVAESINVDELDEALAAGSLNYEDYSEFISVQRYEITKPPIRFELDCDAYVRLSHPAAHFHIGNFNENRWPVCRRLTPRSFCLWITKLYYNKNWERGLANNLKGGFINHFDQYLTKEKLSCGILDAALFHEMERNQLHFS